jgi:hypothetical protein
MIPTLSITFLDGATPQDEAQRSAWLRPFSNCSILTAPLKKILVHQYARVTKSFPSKWRNSAEIGSWPDPTLRQNDSLFSRRSFRTRLIGSYPEIFKSRSRLNVGFSKLMKTRSELKFLSLMTILAWHSSQPKQNSRPSSPRTLPSCVLRMS